MPFVCTVPPASFLEKVVLNKFSRRDPAYPAPSSGSEIAGGRVCVARPGVRADTTENDAAGIALVPAKTGWRTQKLMTYRARYRFKILSAVQIPDGQSLTITLPGFPPATLEMSQDVYPFGKWAVLKMSGPAGRRCRNQTRHRHRLQPGQRFSSAPTSMLP